MSFSLSFSLLRVNLSFYIASKANNRNNLYWVHGKFYFFRNVNELAISFLTLVGTGTIENRTRRNASCSRRRVRFIVPEFRLNKSNPEQIWNVSNLNKGKEEEKWSFSSSSSSFFLSSFFSSYLFRFLFLLRSINHASPRDDYL